VNTDIFIIVINDNLDDKFVVCSFKLECSCVHFCTTETILHQQQ